jgi:hypothetical protein
MIEFKGSHFERGMILLAIRWYLAYPISYRQLEEMMEEHGVEVDHATGRVRQDGGNCGVAEVAMDDSAAAAICGVTASSIEGMSSAIGSVCM